MIRLHHQNKTTTRQTGTLQSPKALQTDIVDTRKGEQLSFDKHYISNYKLVFPY